MKHFIMAMFMLVLAGSLGTQVLAQDTVADELRQQLETTGRKAEVHPVGGAADPQFIAASIVRVFLSLLGTVFFVQMALSGYWLLTARGNEEKVEKAQMTIRRSVIGLAIVLSAYAITQFVTANLL